MTLNAFSPRSLLVIAVAATSVTIAARLPAQTPPDAVPRPLVAIVIDSAGTELTDFAIPRAALAQSGAAQVVSVAASAATVPLLPSALRVKPDMTFGAFDAAFPRGAAYVIVPAQANRDNAAMRSWLKAQAARGATIVSICDGAWIVADAGLLAGHRATTHWRSLGPIEKKFADVTWVRDQRYVVDGRRISTTGVSASLPLSIFLIERIGGRVLADSIARLIGVPAWGSEHRTADFAISKSMYARGILDYVAWWRHDIVAVPVRDGVDEIAFALTMDAIPRTIRARGIVQLDSGTSVLGKQGLRFIVARGAAGTVAHAKTLRIPADAAPATVLIATIEQLSVWYGSGAEQLIAMGMEIPAREWSASRMLRGAAHR